MNVSASEPPKEGVEGLEEAEGEDERSERESIFEALEQQQAVDRAQSKMKYVNELVKRGVEIPENPTYR